MAAGSSLRSSCRAHAPEGIAIDTLAPGTTLSVRTQNSHYRIVVLMEARAVMVTGGTLFAQPTTVRYEGATAGGSSIKVGWILVGCHMEMWRGAVRVQSSRVRSISIESSPSATVTRS